MTLTLPRILKLVDEFNSNQIWQLLGEQTTIDNVKIINIDPFVIQSEGVNYLLTSDRDHQDNTIDYILLTSKIPKRADFNAGRIKIQRWLKHPLFKNIIPQEVVSTWVDKFKFIKENELQNIKGLRPPQIGALHSILAHVQNADDKAIVVMPTGAKKTNFEQFKARN